jgi:hypothetical protein
MTKKLFFKGLATILLMISLSGCAVFDDTYSSGNVKITPEIKYMKDARGNCFAYTSSKAGANKYVVFSISEMSCKNAGF